MHQSVLLEEAVEALAVDPQGTYIDGTFGRGGHSRALLQRLGEGARVMGIDRDPAALAAGRQLAEEDSRFVISAGPFSEFERMLVTQGWSGPLTGLLLDLGVSSPQLDEADRGFSFMRDGPLDMRMDNSSGQTAADWLNTTDREDMVRIFREFGEERFSGRIASAIVDRRAEKPLQRTAELAELIAASVPFKERHKHPATRVFQAVRIAVNNELGELRSTLDSALSALAVDGRLVVISFHSLEDRIVKRFIRDHSRPPVIPRHIPVVDADIACPLRALGRAIKANGDELKTNPRARSAVMRIAQRTDAAVLS